MEIYNLKNISIDNISSVDIEINNNKKIFIDKLLNFFKIYDLYDFYRNKIYNHPAFDQNGNNIGSNNLFTLNNIPIDNLSFQFSSINKDNFKNTIINHIMISNAIFDINNNNLLIENKKITFINTLKLEINTLSSKLVTDVNDIFEKNELFIPIFDDSEFFVFITDDDYKLILFIKTLIDYFLIVNDTEYNIHYDIIKKEIKNIFNIDIDIPFDQAFNDIIFSIKDIINVIPYLYQILIKKNYENKYLGICIVLYLLEFYKSLYYSFVKKFQLYENINNSKIFIFLSN